MKIIVALFLLPAMIACNSGSSTDNVSAKKNELNERSKECIRIMNRAEQERSAALAAGDAASAEMLQQRIDSAAKANVMIGQKLMELDK